MARAGRSRETRLSGEPGREGADAKRNELGRNALQRINMDRIAEIPRAPVSPQAPPRNAPITPAGSPNRARALKGAHGYF
jgi:hypothetical protein